VLTCPQCGAPVQKCAGRCEYCQSEFIVTSLAYLDKFDKEGTSKYVDHYKQLLKDFPDDGELCSAMGICYLSLELYDLAIRSLAKTVQEVPDNADSYYHYALALLRGKRPKLLTLAEIREVERYLNAAIKIDDTKSKYYYLWALVKHDFYRCNGLTIKAPTIEELIDEARSKSDDHAETAKMLERIEIGDQDLMNLVKGGGTSVSTCPSGGSSLEESAGNCEYRRGAT